MFVQLLHWGLLWVCAYLDQWGIWNLVFIFVLRKYFYSLIFWLIALLLPNYSACHLKLYSNYFLFASSHVWHVCILHQLVENWELYQTYGSLFDCMEYWGQPFYTFQITLKRVSYFIPKWGTTGHTHHLLRKILSYHVLQHWGVWHIWVGQFMDGSVCVLWKMFFHYFDVASFDAWLCLIDWLLSLA